MASCSEDKIVDQEIIDAQVEDSENENEEAESNTNNDNDPFPTSGAINFDNGFVLDAQRTFTNFVLPQSEYNKFITGNGDLKMVSKKAYEYLKDEFDFLIILSIEETQPEGLFYGRSTSVQNQVQGLGGGTYDGSGSYGSDGKLKSIIYMPRTEYIRNGPFLHELMHTWGNKGFIPTTVGGHWGFASTGGQLGGFDELIDLGNGSYKGKLNNEDGFGPNANGGNSIPYSNLELYLMGLISSDELESVQVAKNPVFGQSKGEFTADGIDVHSANDLISTNGARVPAYPDAQSTFKALVIIISTEMLDENKKTAINTNLENFARPSAPDSNWSNNFWLATLGKASFEFTVLQDNIK